MADVASGRVHFDSSQDYEKIHSEGSQDVTVANPNFRTTVLVPHVLGYYPHVRVWFLNGEGEMCEAIGEASQNIGAVFPTAFNGYRCYYKTNTTALTIWFDRGVTSGPTRNSTVYWRIYINES